MDDDELIERLRAVSAEVDPVPVWVELAAQAALATRRLDEELAELTHDSWADTPQLVRSDHGPHLLSFEIGAVSLDVQADAGVLRVLVAGASGDLVVESPTGERTAPIGADGWVSVSDLPRGALRLRVTGDDGRIVVTRWFTA
ncbi:hypothetical protein FHS29_006800 [Saccharothrix tamanrassetensis]|uniref:Uncharacterized protein n=1 Tax=Saccharothrix tamanrassetensis TaxID=1051531 RepID=A0A841CVX9_9PSEU|nr:hypothetical protein [Saccharothrix tamanrassetensis]MBB5960177.1 hypothetical protein [Saccharothrix tamanrassetensis]